MYTKQHSKAPEEIVVYMFIIASTTYGLAGWYTEKVNPEWACGNGYGNVKYKGCPTSRRLANFQELVAYGPAFRLQFFVLGGLAFPWIRALLSNQKDIHEVATRSTEKDRCILLLWLHACLWIAFCTIMLLLLMTMTMCHVMEESTEKNLKISQGKCLELEPKWLDRKVIFPIERVILLKIEKLFAKIKISRNSGSKMTEVKRGNPDTRKLILCSKSSKICFRI